MRRCTGMRVKRMWPSIADKCMVPFMSLSLSLVVALSLCAVVSVGAVPTHGSDEMYAKLDGAEEYADVDNVEWHHVKVVDGLLEEDHPIIMYKEDFVNEDFDPSKNRSNIDSGTRHGPRKYKNIAHRRRNRLHHTGNHNNNDDTTSTVVTEKYRALKPKKMLFDVLPQSPLLGSTAEDSAVIDAKFDPSKIRVDVISLMDDNNNRNNGQLQIEGGDEVSKQMLSKHPKKYHRRTRRNAPSVAADADGSVRQKRNPYYYQYPYGQKLQSLSVVSVPRSGTIPKYSPIGKFWNALHVEVPTATRGNSNTNTNTNDNTNMVMDFIPRFGGPNNNETVVWGGGNNGNDITERPPRRPRPVTVTDLFHDSNPANADTSFATRRPNQNNVRPETGIQQPPPRLPSQGTQSSASDNTPVAFPASTSRTIISATTTTERPQAGQTSVGVSNCMWAIVNCCSTTNWDLRYDCFEQFRCSGAFWDLNPCADPIRDNLVNFVNDIYD